MYLFLWKYTDFKNIVQGPQFMCIIGIDIFKKKGNYIYSEGLASRNKHGSTRI